MKKTPPLSEADRSVFRQAMAGVRPLKSPKTVAPHTPKTILVRRPLQTTPKIVDSLADTLEYSITAETPLFFAKSGVQQRTLRTLRQGRIAISAELDLHGKTITLARQSLIHFLNRCHKQQLRCVRIIHGKGKDSMPILKNQLNGWLQQIPSVLAFCSAIPKDGGMGAVYVLLKKQ